MSRGLGTGGAGVEPSLPAARDEGEKAKERGLCFAVCLKSLEKLILDVFLIVDHDSDLKNRC